jgi:hypothetical protein
VGLLLHLPRCLPDRRHQPDRPLREPRYAWVPGPSAELFFRGELLNVFNVFQLCGCGDTVFRNGGGVNLTKINQGVVSPGTGGTLPFNPLTTAPVEGVNWKFAPGFGTAVDRFAYTTPRTFRFSFGARF